MPLNPLKLHVVFMLHQSRTSGACLVYVAAHLKESSLATMSPPETDGVPRDPLAAAIAKQEELLRSMQRAHGEFHPSVADDLAQLAVLYNMRGDHERALTLLHKRLVIHEKFGPPERIGETLHELGTTYRLSGAPDMALQHLERALSTREASLGGKSFKVAETLNSLALLYHTRREDEKAEKVQLQSLEVLLESVEPVDMESEDVPWEVYKRLKQQRGPSTAANSLTLLKDTMRKCVDAALSKAAEVQEPNLAHTTENRAVAFFGATDNPTIMQPHSPERPATPPHAFAVVGRSGRSKSDSAMLKRRLEEEAMDELEGRLSNVKPFEEEGNEAPLSAGGAPPQSPAGPLAALRLELSASTSLTRPMSDPIQGISNVQVTDAATLQARVENLKRRLVSGALEMDLEIARLASDVERIPDSHELRSMGEVMVGLLREMHRMRMRADGDTKQMPVLEGHLEKKSASIFRGFEKRFFVVDPKTFVLSYHFSRDDYARGFAPRGGFPVSRISNIVVHRQPPRGGGSSGYFHFDVVVDLSTRHNPQATRTYELRADSAEALRYWVETLEYYKATAQASSGPSIPLRPGTS